MSVEGPPLEALQRRLLDTGPEWISLAEGQGGKLRAVIADVIASLSGRYLRALRLAGIESGLADGADGAARRRGLALCLRVLSDPWFEGKGEFAEAVCGFLAGDVPERLAAGRKAVDFIEDAERGEELIRSCLKGAGLRPLGENEAAAEDRLNAVDSRERARLVEETRKSRERARLIREAMERAAAEEAASKMTRE